MKHKLWLPLLLLALTLSQAALSSTTWYVDGVHGSDNNNCKSPTTACKTIAHAISLAHSGDSILVAAATYTENLTIGFSLKLIGSGAQTTIIDGGAKGTVVTIPTGHVTLAKVNIRNGVASSNGGGAVYNNGTLAINHSTLSGNVVKGYKENLGGGIRNLGTLTISNSALTNNSAFGTFTEPGDGGGIYNSGTMMIKDSTLSGNYAIGGGGIYNARGPTMTINNSTLSRNYATAGGGVLNVQSATMIINNSTLSSNRSLGEIQNDGAMTISNSTLSGVGDGIGVNNNGTATFQNTIVGHNSKDCLGTMTSKGYNLSSDETCNFNGTGDLNNTDPKLGQLGNYGGPTQTIPLLSGSPAIDAGNPNGCTDGNGHLLKTDQRGKPRPDKEDTGGCDMGAYERQND